MGHSYKGAGCPPGNVTLWKAPTIASGSTGTITITPKSGNPVLWRVDYSPDAGVTWLLAAAAAGDTYTVTGLGSGAYVSVFGCESDYSPQTGRSNAVTVM